MKKYLFFAALAALLTIPGISMAGGMGVGMVPAMTFQAHSIVTMPNNTTVMTTQNFYLKNGDMSFAVAKVDPNNAAAGSTFKGRIAFTGGAAVGKAIIGDVFMNISGLMLNASRTRSAAIGYGMVNGTFSVTQPGSFGNMSTFTPSFTGAYKMQAALGGWTNGQPTYGTAVMSVILSGINAPIFDTNTNTTTMAPVPMVVYMTLPAIPFKIVAGSGDATGTYNVNGMWSGMHVKSDLTKGGPMSMNLTQSGTVVTGMMTTDSGPAQISGAISGGTISMQFMSGNGPVTITGVMNADGTMSGTYKNTSTGETGKWGVSSSVKPPLGITGGWTMNYASSKGMGSGMMGSGGMGSGVDTLNLTQYGGMVLGTESNYGREVMGSVVGTTVTMSFVDGSGGIVRASGALSGTMTGGAYQSGSMMKSGSYMDMMSGTMVDSGTWTATMN